MEASFLCLGHNVFFFVQSTHRLNWEAATHRLNPPLLRAPRGASSGRVSADEEMEVVEAVWPSVEATASKAQATSSAPRYAPSPGTGSDTGSSTSMDLEEPKEERSAAGLQKPKKEPEAELNPAELRRSKKERGVNDHAAEVEEPKQEPEAEHSGAGLKKSKQEPEHKHCAQGVKVKTERVAESSSLETTVLRGLQTERNATRNGEPRKEPGSEHEASELREPKKKPEAQARSSSSDKEVKAGCSAAVGPRLKEAETDHSIPGRQDLKTGPKQVHAASEVPNQMKTPETDGSAPGGTEEREESESSTRDSAAVLKER